MPELHLASDDQNPLPMTCGVCREKIYGSDGRAWADYKHIGLAHVFCFQIDRVLTDLVFAERHADWIARKLIIGARWLIRRARSRPSHQSLP